MTAVLDDLAPIDVVELTERASLQTRFDRKYVIPTDGLDVLLHGLERGTRVLEIGGERDFAYESVYFDTDDLASFLGAARRRRRRFKVRTRTYVDSDLCWVEVKTRGPRGSTVKSRLPYDPSDKETLTDEGRRFADDVLDGSPDDLTPTLTSRYRRSTLYLPGTDSRTTIDTGLVWTLNRTGASRRMPGLAVVETKTGSTPSSTDRLLWRHGHRPIRISKYGTGMAALDPTLPSTPWRRVLDRHVTP